MEQARATLTSSVLKAGKVVSNAATLTCAVVDAECTFRRLDAGRPSRHGAKIPSVLLGTGGFPKLDHFLFKINYEDGRREKP